MDPLDIVAFPKLTGRKASAPRALFNRQLSPRKQSRTDFSPAFSPETIRSLSMVTTVEFTHSGCVNTANFNEDGTLLVTGSDDLRLRIWQSSNFADPDTIKNKGTVHTNHSMNIFHAMFSPASNSIVISSAADGEVRWHDLNNPMEEKRLARFHGMANMFDFQSENVIYATNFRHGIISMGGSVEMIDIRTPETTVRLFDSPHTQVKALAMCPWDTNYIAVGVGDQIWMCDTRMQSSILESEDAVAECVVVTLKLEGVHALDRACRDKLGTFVPLHTVEADPVSIAKVHQSMHVRGLKYEPTSISCIEFSKLSREILVSYQEDAVYRFRFDPTKPLGEKSACQTPIQYFAGHLNSDTFLKRASYFGPNEEYVCCGGDDGNVFIYASATGELVSCKRGDGFSGFGGRGIVNGVAPHPSAVALVSYGLDSTAKLWVQDAEDEDEPAWGKDSNDDLEDEQVRKENQLKYIWGGYETSMERGFKAVSNRKYALDGPTLMLSRCARQWENARKRLSDTPDLPSTSLILAALDDNEMSVWTSDKLSVVRVEYCVRKIDAVREKGNEYFHDGVFKRALEFYTLGVHYCLCADGMRTEMLRTFNMDTSPEKRTLLSRLKRIGSEKISEPPVLRAKFKFEQIQTIEAPSCEELVRICEGFERIWDLFLLNNLNAAQASLKQKLYRSAAGFARRAVAIDKTSVKAKYRLASALKGIGSYVEALKTLEAAAELPDGKTELIQRGIKELKAIVAKRHKQLEEADK